MIRIGIDTGGTFTDFIMTDGTAVKILKLPSTPRDPGHAVLEGLSRLLEGRDGFIALLGSTVATNALLERNGAQTVLVTTHGFEDVLEIGRQNRPELFQLSSSKPEPIIPSRLRLGVKERVLWDGSVLIPLEKKNLDWLRNKLDQLSPQAVAVNLLNSYSNPQHELEIAESLRDLDLPLSLSHQIHPEFREYERTCATAINAYLTPITRRFVDTLTKDPEIQKGKLNLMQSNGGLVSATSPNLLPIRMLLSGPAGGVHGAFEVAQAAGFSDVITFDMGGTSTDVSCCDGRIRTSGEAVLDHLPIPVQTIDIHTIGAGGGSIAWIDSGGLLRVGPHSAGADPGPVCFGNGDNITVTDAHVFLGTLDPDFFLGGSLQLHPQRIRPALEDLASRLHEAGEGRRDPVEIAEGILRIVNTQMEGALRVVSLNRGYDTREFTLVSFGGAGGLHACELARALLMPRVLIPANPGILSAFGIVRCGHVQDSSQTILARGDEAELNHRLNQGFQALDESLLSSLLREGFSESQIQLERTMDVRYQGQAFELNVAWGEDYLERFHTLHERSYGYSLRSYPVEVVSIRVRASAHHSLPEIPRFPMEGESPPAEALVQEKQLHLHGNLISTPFYLRPQLRPGNRIKGPAVIMEYSGTTLVPEGFEVRVDEYLNLILERLGS